MIGQALAELYARKAPRWFKVIRWREWAQRTYGRQYVNLTCIYLPVIFYYFLSGDPLATWLAIKRPKTEEELMQIKRDYNIFGPMVNIYQRDWELDQYHNQVPPVYDMAVRRKKYPQYYEGRYDGFVRSSHSID